MTIVAYRNSIATTLKAEVSELVDVFTADTRLDLPELQRFSKRMPLASVCVEGLPNTDFQNGVTEEVSICISIATKNKPVLKRGDSALLLTTEIKKLVYKNIWPYLGKLEKPTRISAIPMYTKELDEEGAAGWHVTFRQKIRPDDSKEYQYGYVHHITIDYVTQDPIVSPENPEAHDEITI